MSCCRLLLRPSYSLSKRFLCAPANSGIDHILQTVNNPPTADHLISAARSFLETCRQSTDESRSGLLLRLAKEAGVDNELLNSAIAKFNKNELLYADVRSAAAPKYYRLLQALGNVDDGIRSVCDTRAFILDLLRASSLDKKDAFLLRRFEETCKELLTTWFCLSNLKLCRLTWQSPGDILQKVAGYEKVHPVHGLTDIQRRLGPHRRCFYFEHPALPREPLVIVYVALTKSIASTMAPIMRDDDLRYSERDDSTAIYYSISATQKGLKNVDLGHLLIKSVAKQISRDDPQITTHSTLSPIPGFRSYLLRALKNPEHFGCVLDDKCLAMLKAVDPRVADYRSGLLSALENASPEFWRTTPLREVLLYLCARYLLNEKRGLYAVDPVANFHLRNGAEVFRLNWAADLSPRGMHSSFGLMVNYKYSLEQLSTRSAAYINQGVVAASNSVLSVL